MAAGTLLGLVSELDGLAALSSLGLGGTMFVMWWRTRGDEQRKTELLTASLTELTSALEALRDQRAERAETLRVIENNTAAITQLNVQLSAAMSGACGRPECPLFGRPAGEFRAA